MHPSVWLRVTGLTGGELQRRSSGSADDWIKIVVVPPKAYLEFTLAELQAGRIAFLAGDGVASADGGEGKKITFQIQAADAADGTANLSDSDPDTDGTQPAPVSIRVVALKEVEAGQEDALNDDGGLTPDPDTLQAWIDADSTLEIFLELQGAKSGIVVPRGR